MQTAPPPPTGPSRKAGDSYSAQDHDTWLTLYDRQAAILPGRACQAYLDGLAALDLRGTGIPEFHALSEKLAALTGWKVVAVPGLVPEDVFFEHLANRRFPAGNFIRRPDQLDLPAGAGTSSTMCSGHVPMLTDPVFADYMQEYGRGGLRAGGFGAPGQSRAALLVYGGIRFAADGRRFAAFTAPASSPRAPSRCSHLRTTRLTASGST